MISLRNFARIILDKIFMAARAGLKMIEVGNARTLGEFPGMERISIIFQYSIGINV